LTSKIAPAMERKAANESLSLSRGRSDYIRELQRIGLGHDSTASARDRVTALKELVEIDSAPGPVTVVEFNVPRDMMPRQFWEPPSEEPADDDGNEIEG
jgi:hypothetical protein